MIVSIPDLCTLPYFETTKKSFALGKNKQTFSVKLVSWQFYGQFFIETV